MRILHFTEWIIVVSLCIWSGIACSGRESTEVKATSRNILCDTNGNERLAPTLDLTLKLLNEENLERNINTYINVLTSRDSCYSSVVVARAIFYLLNDGVKERWRSIGDVEMKSIAKNIIMFTPREKLESGTDHVFVIHPRVAVSADGREWEIEDGLPNGWQVEEITVDIDGKTVMSRQLRPQEYFREEVVNVGKFRKQLIPGEYVITATLRIMFPNDKRVTLRQSYNFTIREPRISSQEFIKIMQSWTKEKNSKLQEQPATSTTSSLTTQPAI